jgi:putative transposase
MTKLKKQQKWLKEADSSALQNSIKDLDIAFTRFFKKTSQYPAFKSKKTNRNSYRSSAVYIELYGNYIKMPKLGLVECRVSKQPECRIISATISKAPSGKYFVALCCTEVETNTFPKTDKTATVEAPKTSAYETQKVKRLQRSLSRKTIGGSNWEKTRRKLAKEYEKQTNKKLDEFHKLSTKLVRENDIIELNGELPSELKEQLYYKSKWYGKLLTVN